MKLNISKLFYGIVLSLIVFFVFAPLNFYVGAIFAIGTFAFASGLIPSEQNVLGANYAATALAVGQGKLIEKFASTELREIDPVTYKALRKSSEIMFPSHKVLRTREDRPITASYFNRVVKALGAGRSATPAFSVGTSSVLTPSFSTYSTGFLLSMKQAGNNVFSYQEMMNTAIENTLKDFSKGNETTAVNYIYNNRSTVNAGVADGTFNVANATFEIQDATAFNRAILITETNMAENLYGGQALTIFCDSIAWNKLMFLKMQGTSNATNTSFQFEGKTFVRSLGLTAKAAALGYTKGYWIAAADGTFGILDWIPTENKNSEDHGFAKWGNFFNPIDEADYAVYIYGQPLDASATGGYTQDWVENIEFSIDLAPEIAPTDIGGAGETVLQGFALV